jgi:hypothetical protein
MFRKVLNELYQRYFGIFFYGRRFKRNALELAIDISELVVRQFY